MQASQGCSLSSPALLGLGLSFFCQACLFSCVSPGFSQQQITLFKTKQTKTTLLWSCTSLWAWPVAVPPPQNQFTLAVPTCLLSLLRAQPLH